MELMTMWEQQVLVQVIWENELARLRALQELRSERNTSNDW